MTVVAGGNGELVAWVSAGTRELVAATLEAHSAAVADSVSYGTSSEERRRQRQYARQVAELQRQLGETSGPVVLSGPTALVVEVVRDTTVQATHDLDSLVESIAATPRPLSEDAIVELRACAQAATTCVEALIACESSR